MRELGPMRRTPPGPREPLDEWQKYARWLRYWRRQTLVWLLVAAGAGTVGHYATIGAVRVVNIVLFIFAAFQAVICAARSIG